MAKFLSKEALQTAGKIVAVDLAANAASYVTGKPGEDLGLPYPVTLVLSLGVGIVVGTVGTKYVFRNASTGETLLEVDKSKLDDVLDATDTVKKTGASGKLSLEDAEELAFQGTHGPNKADAVVLGKYKSTIDANGNVIPAENSYNTIAKDTGAQYFQLDNWEELSKTYSPDEIWKINEKFLDIQTSSGREIYLSTDPTLYRADGSYFSKEIQYLEENGYRIIKEGDLWHAIR